MQASKSLPLKSNIINLLQLGREKNCLAILERAKKTSGLNHRAFVNAIDSRGFGAIHYAANSGHDTIITLLAKWGVGLDKPLGPKGLVDKH